MNEFAESGRVCGYNKDAPLVISRKVFRELPEWGKLHSHPEGHEFFLFLKGSGEMNVNNEIILFNKGDVILCEPGEKHKVTKITEEIDVLVIRTNTDPSDRINFNS